MRLRTLVGRFGLPLVLAGIATAGAGLPAYADPEDPEPISDVELLVPDRVVAVDGKSKTVEIEIENYGEDAAQGLVLGFGTSPIPAAVGFTPPAGCTVTGCEVGTIQPGKKRTYSFQVSPTADLDKFGATFDVVLKNDIDTWQQSSRVTVVTVDAGVDLELAPIDDIELAPGKSADVPIAFTNSGNKAPAGYGVVLLGDPFLDFPVHYANCFKVEELLGVACAFDEPIEPGETVTLAGKAPIKVHIAADAPGPAEYFAGAYVVGLTEEDLAELPTTAAQGARASALELKPVTKSDDVDPGELNDWDNARTFTVSVSDNPADTAALGGTFTGAVGDSSTVKVGFRNDGPAATPSILQGSLVFLEVKVPTGVEITKVDPLCIPVSGRDYWCLTLDNLRKGEKAEFAFTAKIKSAGQPGSVKIDNGDVDPNKANDTAVLAVKLASTGGTGGGDGGPSLPVTGAPAGLVAGGGALLLLAGGAAVVFARRRRVVTVVD